MYYGVAASAQDILRISGTIVPHDILCIKSIALLPALVYHPDQNRSSRHAQYLVYRHQYLVCRHPAINPHLLVCGPMQLRNLIFFLVWQNSVVAGTIPQVPSMEILSNSESFPDMKCLKCLFPFRI